MTAREWKVADDRRRALPKLLRETPATGQPSALMGEAADVIDYLHAQIASMRREANEEAREATRDARDAYAEGQASARDDYVAGCY